MNKYLLGSLLVMPLLCHAGGMSQQQKEAHQVKLNGNFSWQYMVTNNADSVTRQGRIKSQPAQAPISNDSTDDAPNSNTQMAPVYPGSDKPIMQLSQNGINIELSAPIERDDELIIPTTVSNQSRDSIVQINLQVMVTNQQGRLLLKEDNTVWQSIKRVPETYLRPGDNETGKDIALNINPADTYNLSAKIVSITTR